MDVAFRALRGDEIEAVKWALYEAVSWDPNGDVPPYDVVIDHPELARYHRDWGRAGDLGVVAELDGDVVGVAFCRIFTDDDHGHGYVDALTPEVALAVADGCRGRGIGRELLERLADAARAAGTSRLSLSVDADNRALRLYERLGYRELTRDGGGVRMLLAL